MSGKPLAVLVQLMVFWLYGVVDSRPAVTKASLPPSGRLDFERYRSASTVNLLLACQLAFKPTSEDVTRRSMVWMTISGVNVLAVNDVNRALLSTALDRLGLPLAS